MLIFEFINNLDRYYGKKVEKSGEAEMLEEIARETSEVAFETNVVDFLPLMRWFGFGDVEKKLMSIHRKRDAFMQKVIDDNRRSMMEDNSDHQLKKNKTMVEVLLDLQRSQPAYYTDQTIKNLLLVIPLLSIHSLLLINILFFLTTNGMDTKFSIFLVDVAFHLTLISIVSQVHTASFILNNN